MRRSALLVILIAVGAFAAAPPQLAKYFNDFDKTPLGKPPDDMLILNGDFKVKTEGNNHFLEASPFPVDSLGVLFGPTVGFPDVSAKIYATSTGRRYPEIGVGCEDAGGYKLILLPGQSSMELRRGEEPIAQVHYDQWKSGQWFSFRIKVSASGTSKWSIQGKVWPAADKEPEAWSISAQTTDGPTSGRASVWASPYSGTPVRFDDLSATGEPAKGG